jgi:GNAT superfamily N-acetyltransferase
MTLSVRWLAADEWRTYRELRLGALADAPDAFGSTLEREGQASDEAWKSRLAQGVTSDADAPLVAELHGTPVGLAWGRVAQPDLDTAHLYQMWVAPTARRIGAGRMLLAAFVAWAREVGARFAALNVTCGDTPARRMYARAGFEPIGDPVPLRHASAILAQPMRLGLGSDTVG